MAVVTYDAGELQLPSQRDSARLFLSYWHRQHSRCIRQIGPTQLSFGSLEGTCPLCNRQKLGS